ncbi:hypothetical protein M427DRAFT_183187 [Gonapodya prolifera JEL478]|uniref:Uncharacterized protein n=1 Tax=Gonapodya prolifera (strain JEL478) TaxID=1344416 RepID=A0A139A0U4_GONPJ|nr:hypothetical protein M427DRAFT_183187 [Gonapodya prolifera JEL478]|eukprot:KXS10362.1 hypothetical protein M427DRAFT_183187 [Gonapodya prolifera JEL478]
MSQSHPRTNRCHLRNSNGSSFVATFVNLEGLAKNTFDAVSPRYTCDSNVIESSFATQYGEKTPIVAWMGFNGDSFKTTHWTYKSQMIHDVGGTAIVIPNKALLSGVVKGILEADEADVLIDDTNTTTRLTTIRVHIGGYYYPGH